MEFIPFISVGGFLFSDNYATYVTICEQYNNIKFVDNIDVRGTYKIIFINGIEIMIVFTLDENSVRYFVVNKDIFYNGINLHRLHIRRIRKYFTDLGVETHTVQDILEIPSLGVSVHKELGNINNTVSIYSKSYFEEPPITEDDILHWLGMS